MPTANTRAAKVPLHRGLRTRNNVPNCLLLDSVFCGLSDQQSMSGQRGTSMSAIRGASLAVRPRRVLPVNDTDSRAELPRNCIPFCHPYQARGEAFPVHRARISGPFEWWKLCDPLVSFSSNFPIAEADHVAPAILTAFESPSWSDIRGADDSNCVRRVMLLQCT